jgi:hypothetical protein
MTDPSRNIKAAVERYDERLADIVRRLRRLADDVEREGSPRESFVGWRKGRRDYVYASQRVIHEVAWGIANMHMDLLVDAADDLHSVEAYEAEGARGEDK